MKSLKLLSTVVFVFAFNNSFAMNIPTDSWCGYSEFITANSPDLKDQEGVIRVRALQCTGEPGGVTVPSSKDSSKTCNIPNTTIANNLVKIANEQCQNDGKICMATYNALKVYNPANLKNNAAYPAIFGCE